MHSYPLENSQSGKGIRANMGLWVQSCMFFPTHNTVWSGDLVSFQFSRLCSETGWLRSPQFMLGSSSLGCKQMDKVQWVISKLYTFFATWKKVMAKRTHVTIKWINLGIWLKFWSYGSANYDVKQLIIS